MTRIPLRRVDLKRVFDVVTATVGLAVAAPVIAASAAVVKLTSPGPAVFTQVRVGADGHLFRIYKLRTMVGDAEERLPELQHLNIHQTHGNTGMFKLSGDPRVTPVGRALRRLSLDELPQLVNVIRGEMSLVGPRPLLPEEDRNVHGEARDRLRVRPGITGPWQVMGRNSLSFDRMLDLDLDYVRRPSMRRDLELLARTIPAVVRGEPAC
jgi:lipopolysaccharide/colanic/teichoic acid biosynthesis glycosyltransferase